MDRQKNKTEYDDEYDDDDDDDEFFGSQDDFEPDNSLPIRDFGNMSGHEIGAKHNELKNIGFLDAYDEFKDSRLQEGFEGGFMDAFEAGKIIGKIIGEATTMDKVYEKQLQVSDTKSLDANHHPSRKSGVKPNVEELVHDYFTTKFQKDLDSNNGKQGLENLISQTEENPTTPSATAALTTST
mmetsp:Transcript_2587/g.5626  ORF Transcript_2587/g.5626 Transcript_2587/m.5626 type:complete len:183 (-) Transcript_2587:95-643(-)